MKGNKWIEIISVRLFSTENRNGVREVMDHVRSGCCPVTGRAISAELFMNPALEMDWAIHLFRGAGDGPPGKSSLGVSIAELFASLGIVNHSVWSADLVEKEGEHECN